MTHPLDDDALSAHLDGEGDAATAAHLEECATCRARLEQLRAAADAIASPVPPVDERDRRRAVATALASGGIASGRRRPVPAWVAAAAAAVVLVLAAIPVVSSLRDGRDAQFNSAQGDASGTEAAVGSDDLGDQSDPAALRTLLEQRVGEAAPAPAADALTAEPATESGGGAGGSGAPAGGGSGPDCLAAAREAAGGPLGPLLYRAALQWEGAPATVFVFRGPDPDASALTRRAFVMARRDCQLLVAQSF